MPKMKLNLFAYQQLCKLRREFLGFPSLACATQKLQLSCHCLDAHRRNLAGVASRWARGDCRPEGRSPSSIRPRRKQSGLARQQPRHQRHRVPWSPPVPASQPAARMELAPLNEPRLAWPRPGWHSSSPLPRNLRTARPRPASNRTQPFLACSSGTRRRISQCWRFRCHNPLRQSGSRERWSGS